MHKILSCACTFLLCTIISRSQQANIVSDEFTTRANFSGDFEEANKIIRHANNHLVKSMPGYTTGEIAYEDLATGSRKGTLVGTINGQEVINSGYRGNHFHGMWMQRYPSGNRLDSGLFVQGVPDGEWVSWYPNGKVRTIRTYSSDKWFALRREIYRANSKATAYPLTKLLNFNRRNFDRFTSAKNSFASLPGNTSYHPPFSNCIHHGLYMNFYENGAVKDSGLYKDGTKDGYWMEFYDNGQLHAAGSYFKGARNSGWKYFSRDGRLTALVEYKFGKMVFRKNYH